MLTTRFTELVGCRVPIQQAPIGNCATPRLAAAVANAGALGMVTVTGDSPDSVAARLDEARRLTSGPIGANFFVGVMDRATAPESVAAAGERVRVVDFFYADPDPELVKVAHAGGALVCWQVGSADEARAAEAAGCDFVAAQGFEAGGHVRGTIALLPLLDAVLSAVSVPVLAAGGISSGRTLAAVLTAGAAGARIGTRFVAAEEAEAHPMYLDALFAAGPSDTMHSDTFNFGISGLPHRALRSSVEAAKGYTDEVIGEEIRTTGERAPIHRFQKITPTRNVTGAVEAMPNWAGQGVGAVTRVQPAASIIEELANDAEQLLRRWATNGATSSLDSDARTR